MDVIIRRNYRMSVAYVHAQTPKGAAWIDENLVAPEDPKAAVRITLEAVDELAKQFEDAGLVVAIQ